jgi:hypothetical protein
MGKRRRCPQEQDEATTSSRGSSYEEAQQDEEDEGEEEEASRSHMSEAAEQRRKTRVVEVTHRPAKVVAGIRSHLRAAVDRSCRTISLFYRHYHLASDSHVLCVAQQTVRTRRESTPREMHAMHRLASASRLLPPPTPRRRSQPL